MSSGSLVVVPGSSTLVPRAVQRATRPEPLARPTPFVRHAEYARVVPMPVALLNAATLPSPSPSKLASAPKWLARLLVVLLALGAPALAFAGQKSVTVDVDGRIRHVHTYASDAQSLLRRLGVRVRDNDLVLPGSSLRDGMRITYRSAKPITLLVDGRPTTVTTHGLTVADGLRDLGLKPDPKDYVFPAPTSTLSDGMSVSVRNAIHTKVRVDGRLRDVVSAGATVSELLTQAGIAVGPNDYIAPGPKAKPVDGMWIRVIRVDRVVTSKRVAVPFDNVTVRDPHLASGERRVVHSGSEGLELRKTLTVYQDGRPVSSSVISVKTLREAQNRVVKVGTREPRFFGTGQSQTGLASWYRADGLVAAHPSLPIGKVVRVTDLDTGRSVNVRIADRGPYVQGRIIDLSDEAFGRIASLGDGTVHVRVSW
jgi:uncharacterized protein YabE (DUF348 family)